MSATPPAAVLRILHLEDSAPDAELALRALRQAGLQADVQRVERLEDFTLALQNGESPAFDLILADYHLGLFTALDAHEQLLKSEQNIPMVLLSGAIGEATAVAAIQRGMADFVAKDDLSRLGPAIQRALETHALQRAKRQADAELADSRQRLAAFAQRLQQAVEEERAGIARDIHDGIGGALAALRFDLAWMARQPQEGVSAQFQQRLQSAQHTLGQAVEASQEVMRNLRPAVLDQGLGAALEWLAQGFTQRTQVPVHQRIALAHAASISAQQALTAYRMAQEALTNIQKHAKATQVWLDASDSHGLLTLEVRDNGLGIQALPTPQPDARHGHGLAGLRERATLAGGWLDVGSAPGRGASITLSLPLAEGASGTQGSVNPEPEMSP